MNGRRVLLGSADPFDEAFERERASRAIDRAYYPAGVARQLAAILAAKPRLERLTKLHVPALVIHGVDDVLVPVENGRLVAEAVPGARLIEFDGMGHDVPARLWPQILDAIDDIAGEAKVPTGRSNPGG
jgi:pimeloyl-ACP methyl ester carboxylesterase